ncbi:hypothetical protein [Streptomyces sp. SID9124]|uniref:hypothetical protein n=1 Tax=Streptomyces sp. SID9124 TaxID=2706108 RepID=UPI0013E097DE|nr:hypothetical protein [Streptomyces sp. SID9124]NED11808.1 hypothetical protein [Streptomyces sp. SID9124]
MSSRKSPRLPSGRPLPTSRARAEEQFTLVRAICTRTSPFTAKDLESITGVSASRGSLVMAFWCSCGLAERAPGRGAYKATALATAMAQAWEKGEEHGHAAVRQLWRSQWFYRSARARLSPGPVLREGLVTTLMRLASVGSEYRREVDVLVDLMITAGLLVPQPEGTLRWHEQSKNPAVASSADNAAPTPAPAPADHGDLPGVHLPGPRPAATSAAPSAADALAGGVEDLASLLSTPLQLADLARLTTDELVALHRHLAGLAATASKLRSRP